MCRFPAPAATAGITLACLKFHDGGVGKADDLFVEFRSLGDLALLVLVQVGLFLAGMVIPMGIAAIGVVLRWCSLGSSTWSRVVA